MRTFDLGQCQDRLQSFVRDSEQSKDAIAGIGAFEVADPSK
jgi:hypothetical protein